MSAPRGRRPSARVTNLTLFAALLVTFGTGVGAVSSGTAAGRWVVVGHGVGGLLIIALVPWKSRVVRAGVRIHRWSRWPSLLLAALVVTTLLAGLAFSTGVVRSVGGAETLWWHVALALALVPLALWHIVARRVIPRRTDLSRRNLLRTGVLAAGAGALYAALYATTELTGLPGARRRFTGSYEQGTDDPYAMPSTIWLNDHAPVADPDRWRLTVVDATGSRELSLADLAPCRIRTRALLDCTSGWYAEQTWTGAPVAALLRGDHGSARSLVVRSATGYQVRFPLDDVPHLLLATEAARRPLLRGHGYPLRLVAPGRRGFWWVKWVDRIELSHAPPWWQPPFPLT